MYTNTIDTFSGYDNVLAYNVGNEVIIAANGTGAASFVKAAARDIKAYLYVPPWLPAKFRPFNALVLQNLQEVVCFGRVCCYRRASRMA